tara:strand:+ start:89 stop:739 length:651 start_codon:yes stop_codon:yes gene_type:complete
MKKWVSMLVAAAMVTGLATAQASTKDSGGDDWQYCSNSEVGTEVAVNFFAHNDPNLTEYITGRSKVMEVLESLLHTGFLPKKSQFAIGIAPQRMQGGHVVQSNGKIFVSSEATGQEIEKVLLKYFTIMGADDRIEFFAHNNSDVSDVMVVIEAVEATLARFANNNLKLKLPAELKLGAAPQRMQGGHIVVSNGRLYVSVDASYDALERYFMNYLVE